MLKRIVFLMLALILLAVPCFAAIEDYSTFTEVDEQGDLTRTGTMITISSMRNDADSYIYKDFGVAYFGDFVHEVDFDLTSTFSFNTYGLWAVANSLNAISDLDVDNDDGIVVYFNESSGGSERITLKDLNNENSDITGDINEIDVYITVTRSGTTCTCQIYSDAARTVLVDTLSITCVSTAFRYVYGVLANGADTSDSGQGSGIMKGLELNISDPCDVDCGDCSDQAECEASSLGCFYWGDDTCRDAAQVPSMYLYNIDVTGGS